MLPLLEGLLEVAFGQCLPYGANGGGVISLFAGGDRRADPGPGPLRSTE